MASGSSVEGTTLVTRFRECAPSYGQPYLTLLYPFLFVPRYSTWLLQVVVTTTHARYPASGGFPLLMYLFHCLSFPPPPSGQSRSSRWYTGRKIGSNSSCQLVYVHTTKATLPCKMLGQVTGVQVLPYCTSFVGVGQAKIKLRTKKKKGETDCVTDDGFAH